MKLPTIEEQRQLDLETTITDAIAHAIGQIDPHPTARSHVPARIYPRGVYVERRATGPVLVSTFQRMVDGRRHVITVARSEPGDLSMETAIRFGELYRAAVEAWEQRQKQQEEAA